MLPTLLSQGVAGLRPLLLKLGCPLKSSGRLLKIPVPGWMPPAGNLAQWAGVWPEVGVFESSPAGANMDSPCPREFSCCTGSGRPAAVSLSLFIGRISSLSAMSCDGKLREDRNCVHFLWLLRARFCQGSCFTVVGNPGRPENSMPHCFLSSPASGAVFLAFLGSGPVLCLQSRPLLSEPASLCCRQEAVLSAASHLPPPPSPRPLGGHLGPIRIIQDYRPFSGSFTRSHPITSAQSFLPWKVTFTGPGIRTWISLGGPFFSLPCGLLLLLFASVGSPPNTVPGTQ